MRGRCSRSARSADTRRCRWRPVWPLVDGSPPARSPRCMPSSPAATSRPARMPTASTWWSARPSSPSPSWRAPSTWSSSMPTRPPTATTSRQCFPNSPHVVSSPPTTRCGAAGSSTRPTPPRTRWPSASSTMPWPSTRGWSWSRPPSATESPSSAGQPDTPGFPLWPPVVDGATMLSKGPSTTVLDYHLHLWPHSQRDAEATIEQVAAYCSRAVEAGVEEIALTEHLFRFTQAKELLGGFWDDLPGEALRPGMAAYWDHHARVDLDAYVEVVQAVKAEGLPVVLGLEVDFYQGRMDQVAGLLAGYPFDVLLGSVHWLGTWRFDVLNDPLILAEWDARDIDTVWDEYTRAMEELAASGVCDVFAHRLPPSRRGELGRHARAHRRLGDPIVELAWNGRHPPGDLHQVRVGEDVTHPGGCQLLHGPGVLVPDGIDVPGVPLGQDQRIVQHVESPRAQPVHGSQQHVEGVAGQQSGHLVHAALVEVDLQAKHDRQAFGLHRLDDLDIGVEVHPGVVIPVGGHSRAERLAGRVVPEPAQKLLGLGEPEEVLGEGDLLHPRLDGATAVSRHLLDGGLGITLRVGPEVKVVVQHGRTRSFREHGRSVHNGRPEREAGGVRLPGG